MTYPEAQHLLFAVRRAFPLMHSEITLLPGIKEIERTSECEVVCLGPEWDVILTNSWTWLEIVCPYLRDNGVPTQWMYRGE